MVDGNCDLDETTGGLTRINKTNTAVQLRLPLGGCATDVVVVDQKAYVTVEDDPTLPIPDGTDDRALKIVDVNLMTVLGSYPSSVSPLGVTVVGDYAYLADGWEEGLKIRFHVTIRSSTLPNLIPCKRRPKLG